MCSAGVVGRQDDDDWRTVDVVEQEHQTLACSSSLGTAVISVFGGTLNLALSTTTPGPSGGTTMHTEGRQE